MIETALVDAERCCRDINASSSSKALVWFLLQLENLRAQGRGDQANKLLRHAAETTSLYIEALHAMYAGELPVSVSDLTTLSACIGVSRERQVSAGVVHEWLRRESTDEAGSVDSTTKLYHTSIDGNKHALGVSATVPVLRRMFDAVAKQELNSFFEQGRSMLCEPLDPLGKSLSTKIICRVATSGVREEKYAEHVDKLVANLEEFVLPTPLRSSMAEKRAKDGIVQVMGPDGLIKTTTTTTRDAAMSRTVFGIIRAYSKDGKLPYQEKGCGWMLPREEE